ncbi:hypothetical protein H8D85_01380 [bacterium]|nr:hypothetical protein [bacterium]
MFKTKTWYIAATDGDCSAGCKEFDKYMEKMEGDEWNLYHFETYSSPITNGKQFGMCTTIVVIHNK